MALVVIVVAVIVTMAVAEMSGVLVDAARARTAADSAALAGVEGGRSESERRAADHGGTVVSWSRLGPDDAVVVTVTVRVGRARATAAASNRAAGSEPP